MEVKKGIAVSHGIAISKAFVMDSEDYLIPKREIEPAQRKIEIRRVAVAFKEAVNQLAQMQAKQTDMETGKIKDIFAVHLRFLRDKSLKNKIINHIQDNNVTAEYAVSIVLKEIASHFAKVKDTYISERAADIYDIEKRLLKELLGRKREDVTTLTEEVVVIARELSPMQTAGFNRKFIKALATDAGGRTSHTAIVARSIGIPAVVALENLTSSVSGADVVIVDGNRGLVIVNPDEQTIKQYQKHIEGIQVQEHKLDALREKPAVTRDGTRINILGNIEFPSEAEQVLRKGGDGIGLYRTEFLYLGRKTEPTEQQHYEAYCESLKTFPDRPVLIRTMDLGADKYTQSQRIAQEPNPFLRLRSIRYCLRNLKMFKRQLRAIMRASIHGNVKIMFPLITNLQELMQAKTILKDAMEDLDDMGQPYKKDVEVGIMVETPSAAIMGKVLAREADFFSIGTNDLTQYTLAVDRGNELVATLYSEVDPAVLMLMKSVIRDVYKAKIGLSLCGEMASEAKNIMLLLGMGIRTISIAAPMIPEIKQIVRSVNIPDCQNVADKVLTMETERQISNYLKDATMKIVKESI